MLPVVYVPPVTPPSPDERPPRASRRPRIVLLAALTIGVSALAWAGMSGGGASEPSPATAVSGPSTSGGSQPYLTGVADAKSDPKTEPQNAAPTATAPTKPAEAQLEPAKATPAATPMPEPAKAAPVVAAPAPPTPATPDPATPSAGAEGQPVRVIEMNRKAADAPPAPKPAPSVAEPEAKPAPAPVAAEPTPAKPTEMRGAVAEPAATPAPAPPLQAAPAQVTPPAAARRSTPPVATTTPSTPKAPAKPAEAKADHRPGLQPLAGSATTPGLKPATPVAKAPLQAPPPAARVQPPSNGDFADRLATVRRDEQRRLQAPPATGWEDDEEVVVVPQRRGWSILPPFFDDRPTRPVLRPYDPPPRVAERPVGHSNCHYHAWPTEEMDFHREIACHWHANPRDPSLRYVR